MKNRQFIILIVVLAILSGAYLVQRSVQEKRRQTAGKSGGYEEILPRDFSPEDVRRIVCYAGTNTEAAVTLEEKDGVWRLPDRFDARAATNKVQQLLEKLTSLEGEVRSDSAEVLDEYALRPEEALHVILTDRRDNSERHILAGKKGPRFGTSFVRREGSDAVYLVGVDLRREFNIWGDELKDPDPKVWVDLRVVQVDEDAVRRLAMDTPWSRVVLEKREVPVEKKEEEAAADDESVSDADEEAAAESPDAAGTEGEEEKEPETEWKWFVVEPEGRTLAEDGVKRWVESLNRFNALDVVDPEKIDEYGFDPPEFALEIGLDGGTNRVLQIGSEVPETTGERYVRVLDGENVFKAAKWALKNAVRRGRDLFELAPFTLDREKVQSLAIAYPEGKGILRFERNGDEWLLVQPELGLKPLKSSVDGAVGQAASIRPEDFVTKEGFDGGVDRSKGAFTIVLDDGTEKTLVFGDTVPVQDPARFARWEGEPEIFVAQGALYSQVMRDPGRYLDLELLHLAKDRVKSVTLTSGDTVLRLTPSEEIENQWDLTAGDETTPAKDSAVQDLLAGITSLRALGVVLDPEAEPGFEETARKIVFTLAPEEEGAEPETCTLVFGRQVEGNVSQRYFRIDGREGLFKIAASYMDRVMKSADELRETPAEEPAEEAVEAEEGAEEESEPSPPESAEEAGEPGKAEKAAGAEEGSAGEAGTAPESADVGKPAPLSGAPSPGNEENAVTPPGAAESAGETPAPAEKIAEEKTLPPAESDAAGTPETAAPPPPEKETPATSPSAGPAEAAPVGAAASGKTGGE